MTQEKYIIKAPAKTNLWLRVCGVREDGFHAIESRMVHLSLCDQLELTWTNKEKVQFTCSDPSLPTGEDNLVVKAVRVMEKHLGRPLGIKIHLSKNIPSGAGLGGGSSDAAAVIKSINTMGSFGIPPEELVHLAASIGSDIPFFIYDQPCDVSGRGEIVVPIDKEAIPRLPIFLMKPAFEISAAWAYQNLAKSNEMNLPTDIPQVCQWGSMENDLERPVYMKFPILRDMKKWLLKQPEVHAALLSGSGSTMLAVLRHFDGGDSLSRKAREHFGEETWTYCGFTA